jgi:hypothetical protein
MGFIPFWGPDVSPQGSIAQFWDEMVGAIQKWLPQNLKPAHGGRHGGRHGGTTPTTVSFHEWAIPPSRRDRPWALFDEKGHFVNGKNHAKIHNIRSWFDLQTGKED